MKSVGLQQVGIEDIRIMTKKQLDRSILEAAIHGFESQKRQIDAQIAELRGMLYGGSAETAAPSEAAPLKRKAFSAAARRRMREAQQRRWAKSRGESRPTAAPEAPKAKPRISEEGMKRIIAATKKRWARVRAEKAAAARAAAAKKGVIKKAA